MFRGLTPSLVAVIPSKAVFFAANAKCRTIVSKHFTQQSQYVNLTAGKKTRLLNLILTKEQKFGFLVQKNGYFSPNYHFIAQLPR